MFENVGILNVKGKGVREPSGHRGNGRLKPHPVLANGIRKVVPNPLLSPARLRHSLTLVRYPFTAG